MAHSKMRHIQNIKRFHFSFVKHGEHNEYGDNNKCAMSSQER